PLPLEIPEPPEPTPPPLEIPEPPEPTPPTDILPPEMELVHEPGENKHWNVRVYLLSIGAFGRRALVFLKANSIEFDYVYVDQLGEKIADEIREKLKEKFGRHVSYPFLVLDDKKCLIGFDENEYRALFGIY
ncbi:MAG: glutaredoxin family protein, partial [Promethearchaeota archaeon]